MSVSAIFLASTVSLGIFSCDATGTKQEKGAVIGAVIGGLIGNRIADDSRTVGTVIGAAVGGAAGSYIGCQLQKKDQERLAADSQRALANGTDATWTSPDSGIQAVTNVRSVVTPGRQPIALASGITPPTGLTLSGIQASARRDVAIKAAINPSSRTVGGLGAGDLVDVLGRTGSEGSWSALEKDGVLIGYVPTSALRPTGQVSSANASAATGLRTVNVQTRAVCRTVVQTITPPEGQPQSREVQACVQPDGSWKTT
jgi:surface antigen